MLATLPERDRQRRKAGRCAAMNKPPARLRRIRWRVLLGRVELRMSEGDRCNAVYDRPLSQALTALLTDTALVHRFAGGVLQPLDLVLDHQFPALEFDNLQVVC